MRVYADHILNIFYIEGVSQGSVNDFVIETSGAMISFYRPSLALYDLKNVSWTNFVDKNDNGFATMQDLLTYLNNELTVRTLSAIYPLVYDLNTGSLTIDKTDISDGGSY